MFQSLPLYPPGYGAFGTLPFSSPNCKKLFNRETAQSRFDHPKLQPPNGLRIVCPAHLAFGPSMPDVLAFSDLG